MPKQRETCTECSLRRQKCDKKTPCGRCLKRGIAFRCTRVWSTRQGSREEPDTTQLAATGRLTSISRSGTRIPDASATSLPDFVSGPQQHIAGNPQWQLEASQTRAMYPDNAPLSTSGYNSTQATNPLQLELPSTQLIWELVRFHERSLLWYHGCYHGPTLREELQSQLHDADGCVMVNNDLQWAALLFAILAGSLICANDKQVLQWRFRKADVSKQAARWYRASVASLDAADYSTYHTVHAVQAIATLTVSAHVLGFSNKQSVLLGAALKISQTLGIHRLELDPSLDATHPLTEEEKKRVLDRETRRRLWSQLCVQDWFSVPSTEAYNINPLFATSIKPANRDFLTMELVPEDIPTYVSYGNYLNDIARILAGLQEALATSHTVPSHYERIMEFDADMRELATKGRPLYFNVTQPIDPDWQDFVPWARRSLTICFSHKIIMIHRPFLSRSFTNSAFSFTRQTCVAAAKTIINEAKHDNADGGPIIWIDQAFCVAAGIVLGIDARHRLPAEPTFDEHILLVRSCISYLARFSHSAISARGTRLLAFMLSRLLATQNPRGHTIATGRSEVSEAEAESYAMSDLTRERLMHDLGQGEFFPAHTGFTNTFIMDEILGSTAT